MARPERFELPTPWFEAKCSIRLSYGRHERPSVRLSGPACAAATRACMMHRKQKSQSIRLAFLVFLVETGGIEPPTC